MKIGIADDEKIVSETVFSNVKQYLSEQGVPAEFRIFDSPRKFMDSLEDGERYDVVFMDVYFDGEEETGVDAIQNLRQKDNIANVIFLTSSTDHMQDAFKVHAFSYIIKEDFENMFPQVMDDLLSKLPENRSITLTSGKQTLVLPIADIISVQTDGHYLVFRDKGGKEHRIRMTFSEITKRLENSKSFLLVNKGIVVNMEHIRDFKDKNVNMMDGSTLPVRVRGYSAIVKQWHEYNINKLRTTGI